MRENILKSAIVCNSCVHDYEKKKDISFFAFFFVTAFVIGIWYGATWIYELLALKYGGVLAFKLVYGFFCTVGSIRLFKCTYDWTHAFD